MSDRNYEEAARALESRDVLEGTFKIGGETHPLQTLEPTLGEIEEMESDLQNANQLEEVRSFVDRYLERPEVNADDVGITALQSLFVGMRQTWNDMDAIEGAEEDMELEKGNRQTSRQ